jgi:hypothetical protein
MDIISAYQETGSYRGAAELCGTTHKTVKRVIERAEAGGVRRHYHDPVDQVVTGTRGDLIAVEHVPHAQTATWAAMPSRKLAVASGECCRAGRLSTVTVTRRRR